MLAETSVKPKSRVQLTVTGSAKEFSHQLDAEIAERSKNVKVPGFRPGHAPKERTATMLGAEALQAGALDRLVSELYFQAVQESKLVPVGQPEVDISHFTPEEKDAEVLRFTADFDVLPDVDLDGYDKIVLKTAGSAEATDEDVAKVTDYLRKQRAQLETAAEGVTLELGMWADLAYQGSVGGVARDDMKNEHHPLILGEGQLIPGFEEQLVGMKPTQTREITVTFPADYHAADLKGKDAQFTATLNELKTVTLPELDGAFAETFGHTNVEELLGAIRTSLAEEKAQEAKQALEEEALSSLVSLHEFEIPESLVAQEMTRLFGDARKRLEQIPGQWERYLEQTGKTVEEMRQDLEPQAERNVRSGIVLGKLVQLMGIKDTDKAGQQALDQLVTQIRKG